MDLKEFKVKVKGAINTHLHNSKYYWKNLQVKYNDNFESFSGEDQKIMVIEFNILTYFKWEIFKVQTIFTPNMTDDIIADIMVDSIRGKIDSIIPTTEGIAIKYKDNLSYRFNDSLIGPDIKLLGLYTVRNDFISVEEIEQGDLTNRNIYNILDDYTNVYKQIELWQKFCKIKEKDLQRLIHPFRFIPHPEDL